MADVPGLPRFNGGLVGYFGYDCVRYVEQRLAQCPNPDPLETPDILLMVSEEIVVFDNLAGKLHAIVVADPARPEAYEEACARLEGLLGKLRLPLAQRSNLNLDVALDRELDYRATFTREDYQQAVDRVKEYILAGDCMQVVPSQRMSIDFKAEPIDLYRALRSQNPTPYMYFFNFGDFHVVGSSPEVLVRVEDGEVTVRPIAGTRPRGATRDEVRNILATSGTTAASPQEPKRCLGSAVTAPTPSPSSAATVRDTAPSCTSTSASQKISTSPRAASANW